MVQDAVKILDSRFRGNDEPLPKDFFGSVPKHRNNRRGPSGLTFARVHRYIEIGIPTVARLFTIEENKPGMIGPGGKGAVRSLLRLNFDPARAAVPGKGRSPAGFPGRGSAENHPEGEDPPEERQA